MYSEMKIQDHMMIYIFIYWHNLKYKDYFNILKEGVDDN